MISLKNSNHNTSDDIEFVTPEVRYTPHTQPYDLNNKNSTDILEFINSQTKKNKRRRGCTIL